MTIDQKTAHSGNTLNTQNLLQLAQNAYDDHDWHAAIALYEDYLQIHRGNPRIYYSLAQCYEKLEMYEQANEFYRRC